MNAKTCKELRRNAIFHVGLIPTKYEQIQVKTRKLYHPPINDFIMVPIYQTKMVKCTRSVYKEMKKRKANND